LSPESAESLLVVSIIHFNYTSYLYIFLIKATPSSSVKSGSSFTTPVRPKAKKLKKVGVKHLHVAMCIYVLSGVKTTKHF